MYGNRDQLAVFPLDIDSEPASCPEPGHLAALECRRQCGKNLDLFAVALKQHFGNATRGTEIPVDLERWMRVEQVWIRIPA